MIENNIYTKVFQRKIEDFLCSNCGAHNTGDGYRNHCSKCLTSKHVDVYPGDRAATCGGFMQVIDITLEHGKHIIVHQCEKCGHKKRNKTHKEDSIDTIIQFMRLLQF